MIGRTGLHSLENHTASLLDYSTCIARTSHSGAQRRNEKVNLLNGLSRFHVRGGGLEYSKNQNDDFSHLHMEVGGQEYFKIAQTLKPSCLSDLSAKNNGYAKTRLQVKPRSGGRLTVGGERDRVRVHDHVVGQERLAAQGRDGHHPDGQVQGLGLERLAAYGYAECLLEDRVSVEYEQTICRRTAKVTSRLMTFRFIPLPLQSQVSSRRLLSVHVKNFVTKWKVRFL